MEVFVYPLGALAAYMSALFVVSIIAKNNGVADIGYGGAVLIAVASMALVAPPLTTASFVVCLLVALWALRLGIRIYIKNFGKPEDFRYRAWRESWGRFFFVRSFLQIYMLQGAVAFIIALPILLSLAFPERIIWAVYFLGVALWCIGFIFESIADLQLDRFIKNPQNKGSIMTVGLWRFSRHPNYFGESLMWWGLAVACVGLTSTFALGFLSPILITFLLLKVSGVPMLEKRWEGNPAWEEYKARTSVFIPLPPKSAEDITLGTSD